MQTAYSVWPKFSAKRKDFTSTLSVMLAVILATVSVVGQAPKPAMTKPKGRLSTAIDLTLQKGHESTLPPHVSTLLGISKEQPVSMKQAVEMGEPIRGFEVSSAEPTHVVIFVENRTAKETTFYLSSRAGTLRKVLSVKEGTGHPRNPTKQDVEDFRKEKQHWVDRLVPNKP